MYLPLASLLLLSSPVEAGKRRSPDLDGTARELLGRALVDTEAYDELTELADDIGHRLAGSPQLDEAIAWGARHMEADGLDVRTEPVQVPVWIRGAESLRVVAPRERDLALLGLGGTIGAEVEAEVVAARSFDELDSLPVEGRIVLFDAPFTDYGSSVQFRVHGAVQAARRGAVGVLVRSVTPESLSTPHTGAMRYDDEVTRIPAAAVTVEDAGWMRRLLDRGETVRVALSLGASMGPDAESANVIGEVRGRSLPDEVVVVGCHLDSWDVGQGAQDDGAGCVMAMDAGRLLAALPVAPRRTVRVVLYTNEENGLRGGRSYAEAHAGERHYALLEADTGSGAPLGWRVDVRRDDEAEQQRLAQHAIEQLAPLASILDAVGAGTLTPRYSGADIGPTVEAAGAVGLGLSNVMDGYWRIHHTEADTIDKVDPSDLAKNVAVVAVTAWFLAERPEPLLPVD